MATETMSATQTWPALLARLVGGGDLDTVDTAWVMDQVLAGDATPVQLAGFLVALRSKGETAAEITGLEEAMLRHTRRVVVEGRAVDVVGTGGDHAHPVNISDVAVHRGGGVPEVAGNRAATSDCVRGRAAELGVAISLSPGPSPLRRAGRHRCFAAAPVDAAHRRAAPGWAYPPR
jgi:anthranilate phosphoribosyltransferase